MNTMNTVGRIAPEVMRSLFSYDPISGSLKWKHRSDMSNVRNARFSGKEAGVRNKKGIDVRILWGGRKQDYRAHHIAWAIMTGRWPAGLIDHRDGDPYNNAWLNLRESTDEQNCSNQRKVRGSVPFKGVCFHKASGKYRAQIQANKQKIGLGEFDCTRAAAEAYDAAAEKYHGVFAATNRSLGLLGDAI